MTREVAEATRGVFNALNREEAERQLDRLIQAYQDKACKLAAWAAEAIPEALTVFAFPEAHRRRVRTSNMVECLNKEPGVSQPTIGRRIGELKQALEVALFERGRRGLVLTPQGRQLVHHVNAMADAAGHLSLASSGHAQSLLGNGANI